MPASNAAYRARRKAAHRFWLHAIKTRCERCGDQRLHMLTIVDRATGKGLGLGASGWGVPEKVREDRMRNALVLCQACGHHYRRGLRDDTDHSTSTPEAVESAHVDHDPEVTG